MSRRRYPTMKNLIAVGRTAHLRRHANQNPVAG
jgi:hypothetical protein